MNNFSLNKKQISFTNTRLSKAKEVRIIKSNAGIYVEILPEKYNNQMDEKELYKVYASFLRLGKNMYELNKTEISKIACYSEALLPNLKMLGKYFLGETDKYIESLNSPDIIQVIETWAKNSSISTKVSSNYILLKNNDWNYDSKLKIWLKSNFVPIIEDEYSSKNWRLADCGRLIDMAIFFYLVTAAISKRNNVKFSDFIEVNKFDIEDFSPTSDWTAVEEDIVRDNKLKNTKKKKEELDLKHSMFNVGAEYKLNFDEISLTELSYLKMVNEIIHMFEISNLRELHGYNKLNFNIEKQKIEMIREYDNIFGVLWDIFKLQISDSYIPFDNMHTKKVKINICHICGNPFLGTKKRCEECNINDDAVRKFVSRKNLSTNIKKIKLLLENNEFTPEITTEAEALINKKNSELDVSKRKVDEILNRLESKVSKKNNL